MRQDNYKKAAEIQSKIHRLDLIRTELEGGEGLSPIGCYDPDTDRFIECDADVMEKISTSILAIINIEIKNLKNEFLSL